MKNYKTFGKCRSLRLKDIDYGKIMYPLHITIGTEKKQSVFAKKEYAEIVIQEIKNVASRFTRDELSLIVAWCLMPDHLHLLFNPDGKAVNVLEIVKHIKGRSATRLRNLYGIDKLWQKSFYDRILRKEEDIKEVSLYILNNPVRGAISKTWEEYLYSGSTFFDK